MAARLSLTLLLATAVSLPGLGFAQSLDYVLSVECGDDPTDDDLLPCLQYDSC